MSRRALGVGEREGKIPNPDSGGNANTVCVGDGAEKLPLNELFKGKVYLLHFLAFHGGADVNHKNQVLV